MEKETYKRDLYTWKRNREKKVRKDLLLDMTSMAARAHVDICEKRPMSMKKDLENETYKHEKRP